MPSRKLHRLYFAKSFSYLRPKICYPKECFLGVKRHQTIPMFVLLKISGVQNTVKTYSAYYPFHIPLMTAPFSFYVLPPFSKGL